MDRCSFEGFRDMGISNWYATRTLNNTTIYMDLEESSGSALRIRSNLEFYLPLAFNRDRSYSPLPLSRLAFPIHPFSTCTLSSSPLTRIAGPGISQVLSRIQRLQNPTWTDRQSSLPPPPPPPQHTHFTPHRPPPTRWEIMPHSNLPLRELSFQMHL